MSTPHPPLSPPPVTPSGGCDVCMREMRERHTCCISIFCSLLFRYHGVLNNPPVPDQDAYDKDPSKAGLEDPASEAAKRVRCHTYTSGVCACFGVFILPPYEGVDVSSPCVFIFIFRELLLQLFADDARGKSLFCRTFCFCSPATIG